MEKIKRFKINASTTISTTANTKINDDSGNIILNGEYKKGNDTVKGTCEIPKNKIDFTEILPEEEKEED